MPEQDTMKVAAGASKTRANLFTPVSSEIGGLSQVQSSSSKYGTTLNKQKTHMRTSSNWLQQLGLGHASQNLC